MRPGLSAFGLFLGSALLLAAARGDEAQFGKLIADLADEDEWVRVSATFDLGRLGPKAAAAEKELLPLLGDESRHVRSAAADAILKIGGKPAAVVPLLDDPDDEVSLGVAEALLARNGDPQAVLPALVRIEAHPRQGTYSLVNVDHVVEALNTTLAEQIAPLLINELSHDDENRRHAGSRLLSMIEPLEQSAVPHLAKLVGDRRAEVRALAYEFLRRMGPIAADAAPALRVRLDAAAPDEAADVAAALAAVVTESDAAKYVAIAARPLGDEAHTIRIRILSRLSDLRGRAAPAAPQVIALLSEEFDDREVNLACHAALKSIGRPAVTAIIGALRQTSDDEIRETLLDVLKEFGPEAGEAVAQLAEIVRSESSSADSTAAALAALGAIGPGSRTAMDLVMQKLRSPSAKIRGAAAEAAGKIGALTDDQLRRLLEAAGDKNVNVRLAAARGLAASGASAERAVAMVARLVNDDDVERCLEVLHILESFGSRAEAAIPRIAAALQSEESVAAGFSGYSITYIVANTLTAIGKPAVPELIKALRHEKPRVRGMAAYALGHIGPDAAPAVDELLRLLNDRETHEASMGCMFTEFTVCEDAIEALGQIGPAAKRCVPRIVDILRDETAKEDGIGPELLRRSAVALGAMGTAAQEAAPVLNNLLRKDDAFAYEYVRVAVIVALARVEPESPATAARLREHLESVRLSHPADCRTDLDDVIRAVIDLGPGAQPFLPLLRGMYAEWPVLHPWNRCDAACAVARIEPTDRAAVAYLERMARRSDWFSSHYARERLDELRGATGRHE